MTLRNHTEDAPPAASMRVEGQARRVLFTAFAAMFAGSRAVPLGDNGALFRDLAARIGRPGRATPDGGAAASTDR